MTLATTAPVFRASHNDLRERGHIPDFPDQKAITGFLRTLLRNGRTQVTWAEDARVKYNALTNWFTDKPARMNAENLLRLIIAAEAEDELADWLATYRSSKGAIRGRPRSTSGGAGKVVDHGGK